MSDNVDYSDPRSVLLAFFTAMNAWEKECWQRRKEPDIVGRQTQAREEMEAIFEAYCTPKERKYGRLGSFSNPPEYDPVAETILSVTEAKNRCQIETQQSTGFCHKNLYVLHRKDGRWLVDNKQWFAASTSKWQRCGL